MYFNCQNRALTQAHLERFYYSETEILKRLYFSLTAANKNDTGQWNSILFNGCRENLNRLRKREGGREGGVVTNA